MLKIEEFVKRNGMSETEKREMLEILNESLLEISRGILEKEKVEKEVKVEVKENVKGEKRYKSKKAEEYANEHGISLEDFSINEVSKKDVEIKVREITKAKNNGIDILNKKSEEKNSNKKNEKEKVKREKVICSGINKKGECCKSVGTIQPEGAKKKYCFRHAEDFRSFECESDSSDEENESVKEENESVKEENESVKEENESVKEENESELEEEEYN